MRPESLKKECPRARKLIEKNQYFQRVFFFKFD